MTICVCKGQTTGDRGAENERVSEPHLCYLQLDSRAARRLLSYQEDEVKRVLLLCLMFLAVILAASAGPVHAAYTWAAQGTASDGRPDNGLVTFNFTSLTSLSITLQNTAGPSQLGGISSVLDGLTFSLSGAPTGITLTGAQAFGTVDATNGLAFNSPSRGITQTGSTPFGWSMQSQGGTLQLFAGNGSFKPYGIVNSNITVNDGIDNAEHNPYINGPVTFNFNVTGLSSIRTSPPLISTSAQRRTFRLRVPFRSPQQFCFSDPVSSVLQRRGDDLGDRRASIASTGQGLATVPAFFICLTRIAEKGGKRVKREQTARRRRKRVLFCISPLRASGPNNSLDTPGGFLYISSKEIEGDEYSVPEPRYIYTTKICLTSTRLTSSSSLYAQPTGLHRCRSLISCSKGPCRCKPAGAFFITFRRGCHAIQRSGDHH